MTFCSGNICSGKQYEQLKGHHQSHMKTDHRLSRRIPASGVHDHTQPESRLTVLSPFLKHVNMRTLALLMFVSFAVLNTTHGNDGEMKQQVTANIETQVIANRRHDLAQTATPPANCTNTAPSILWQFLTRSVNDFDQALNDPALIEYAKEQGVDTSGLPAALSQAPAHQSRMSSSFPATD
jgi:hypothetical protein